MPLCGSCSARGLLYALRRVVVPVEEDLRAACEDTGSVQTLKSLLLAYPSLDLSSSFALPRRKGYTPLALAARCGHLELVKCLVEEERVPVDEHDSKWCATPLQHAARKNCVAVMAYLIEEGADVNQDTVDGNLFTALHWAASRGFVEAADLLLKKGAVVDAADKNGSTALHWACFHGQEQMIRLLLSRGASKGQRNYMGQLPIAMYRNRFGNSAIAELLSVEKEGASQTQDEMKEMKESVVSSALFSGGVFAEERQTLLDHPDDSSAASKSVQGSTSVHDGIF